MTDLNWPSWWAQAALLQSLPQVASLPHGPCAQAGLQALLTHENLSYCKLFADKTVACLLHARPWLRFPPPACELCRTTGNTARRPVKQQCTVVETLKSPCARVGDSVEPVQASVYPSRIRHIKSNVRGHRVLGSTMLQL